MLNKDELLRRTNSGLEVFRRYIPGQWRVGRNFLNPLYEDRKASCNIYFERRSGCYRLKDFGNDAYSGDCFDIVGQLKGLDCSNPKDFVEILKTINHDLCLGLYDDGDTSFAVSVTPKPVQANKLLQQPEPPKKVKPYTAAQQPFSAKELSFWQQYGISSETLKAYKVFSFE